MTLTNDHVSQRLKWSPVSLWDDLVTNSIAVLPSRSASSDLGLIADLFEKNASKLVLFLPEKPDFHFFSFPHEANYYLTNFLKDETFSNKN